MILSFHPCFDTDVQIILGDRPLGSHDLALIQKAEAIILPQTCPQALYQACQGSHALKFPRYEMRFKYPGKVGQSLLFRDFKRPQPKTLIWADVQELKVALLETGVLPHERPFLIKEDKSHEGEGVYVVEDELSLSEALEELARRENSGQTGFVTQDFIPSKGNALRAVIIGKRIMTYWKRPATPGQPITTIRRGAVIDHHWREDLQEKGKTEVQALSEITGINLAAVDFVFPLDNQDPDPFFLEINYYFGRRGLGGTERYYTLLHEALQEWFAEEGFDPKSIRLL
jgi:ribosomal protein S6--L-glutamate ligase